MPAQLLSGAAALLLALLALLLPAAKRQTENPLSPTTSRISLRKGLKVRASTRPVCPAARSSVPSIHSVALLTCCRWQVGSMQRHKLDCILPA